MAKRLPRRRTEALVHPGPCAGGRRGEAGRNGAGGVGKPSALPFVWAGGGLLSGDYPLLASLAGLLMQAVRSKDLVARFGGEEFILLLRGTTLEEAHTIMERIRRQVEQHTFLYQHQAITVTISVGLTPYQMSYRRMDDWLQCVDQRLYEAKRRGRNPVS